LADETRGRGGRFWSAFVLAGAAMASAVQIHIVTSERIAVELSSARQQLGLARSEGMLGGVLEEEPQAASKRSGKPTAGPLP
jgi:hypothetical protein